MLPPFAPERLIRAHDRILPIYRFLAQYEGWLAEAPVDYCDFALGNPQAMPLGGFVDALRTAATPRSKDWYAYKMSEPSSRRIIQAGLTELTGRPYGTEDIYLTNGATGALMVALNALIGAEDEVIYNSPPWFFYEGMIINCGGRPVSVNVAPETFDLDVEAIERAITARTRAVIVNSPNNPTGKIYAPETLKELGGALERARRRLDRAIYVISDEAYRTIVYDGKKFPSPTNFYRNSIMIYTYGKTLLTPGQRIGYVALSPEMDRLSETREAILSSQILCGWAMASALMQHSLPDLQSLSLDLKHLQRKRDRLVAGLRDCGYDVRPPEGAFYVTPKASMADDAEFARILAAKGVYCLPGGIVNMPGRLRLSVTASDAMIERALPRFAAAAGEARA